jgi:FixJ family two-component response regulator
VKAGAFDFLEKPVDAERLLDKLEKAIKQKTLIDENEQLKAKLRTATSSRTSSASKEDAGPLQLIEGDRGDERIS